MGDESATVPAADPALARVTAAVTRVDDLAERPLAEHAAAYQEIHGELQAALAEIDGG